MESFPSPLFALACASAVTSALTLVFATLIISVSNILWIFPAAFALTCAYHGITILISNTEQEGSARLFSLAGLIAAYTITLLWLAASILIATVTAMFYTGKWERVVPSKGLWSMILPCVFAFLEALIMASIAFFTRRERNKLMYASKWKWRDGHNPRAVQTQWSINSTGSTSR